MALTQKYPIFTKENYLEFEKQQLDRHEFIDGNVYAMAGESLNHSRICFSLYRIVGNELRGKRCNGFSPNMKIATNDKGLFSYPDLAVVCGDPELYENRKDVITNPTEVFEVLSPSTASYDRGEKFLLYTNYIESLKDYILISQDELFIEHFTKQVNGSWESIEIKGLDAVLQITSIECEITPAELYEQIDFSA